MTIQIGSAVHNLVGLSLEGGWAVKEKIKIHSNATGGNFSVSYIVESSTGEKAFLKALDISKAMKMLDPARELQRMTASFNFERDVLNKCKDARMNRVVTALADGSVMHENETVQYLIFELADGDVRSQSDISEKFDTALSLRYLHNVAIGLNQLHQQKIAHQDLKPSNVLIFNGNESKIADLGRAAEKGFSPPHEELDVAGDRTYAPPELLYGQIGQDWKIRRLGCDLYHLGSMVVFFYMGSGTTTNIIKYLNDSFHWRNWEGYYEDVLPYIRDGFEKLIEELEAMLPEDLRTEIIPIVLQLCEPDPILRGHPKNRHKPMQYSLERYISKFDLLAKKAEYGLIGRK